MKKTAIFTAALLLFTAACGTQSSASQPADTGKTETANPQAAETAAPQPTEAPKHEKTEDDLRLEELLKENSTESILKRHLSWTLRSTLTSLDNQIGSEYWYEGRELFFYITSTDKAMFITPDEFVVTRDDEPGTVEYVLANPAEVYKEWLDAAESDSLFELSDSEYVSGIEERDGHIYYTTVTTDNTIKQSLFEQLSKEYGGPDYQEDLELSCIYEFDPETSDLLTMNNIFTDANGKKVLDLTDTYTYDIDFFPDVPNKILTYFFNDKPRKVTVTFNAGTDQAVKKEFMLPEGVVFSVFNNDELAEAIYADEACTQPLEKTDRTSDIAVYVK
jgi:hypothetical protein